MRNPGTGNIKKALETVLKQAFSKQNGARENVPKSLILFANKKADTSNVSEYVKQIRNAGVDLTIVAIDGDGKPFRTFVDDPNKLFVFKSVDDIDKLTDKVTDATLPGKIFS